VKRTEHLLLMFIAFLKFWMALSYFSCLKQILPRPHQAL